MKRRRALTLIELLIVIAIIAILSAAALAVVIAPMADVHRSRVEDEMNSGFGLFHASLVGDLHDAVEARANGDSLDIVLPDAEASTVRYAVDDQGILRRHRGDGAGVALLRHVESVEFARDDAFVRFRANARFSEWDRDFRFERDGRIAVGLFAREERP